MTTIYFGDDIYPADKNGKADTIASPQHLEVYLADLFDGNQIHLQLISEDGQRQIYHLSKDQTLALAEGAGKGASFTSPRRI